VKPGRLAAPPAVVAFVAAGIGLLCAAPAQAQLYHLYLLCQGTVAAGPGAASAADSGLTPRGAGPGQAAAADAADSDKNTGAADGDENTQARARAVRSAAKRGDASLELALRDNNMTALVQRSNVLPTGERLKYQATQTHYTVTYLPLAGSASYQAFRNGWLFGWYPPFQKLTAARFAVDRQTGVLEGDIVGPAGEVLGLIDMQCEPKRAGEGPAPRF
jgi:hypothetical protein